VWRRAFSRNTGSGVAGILLAECLAFACGSPQAPQAASKIKPPADSFKVVVRGTPEGFLNVREDASVEASKAAEVKEGDTFDVLEEKGTWYKIEYTSGSQGWISSEYTRKEE